MAISLANKTSGTSTTTGASFTTTAIPITAGKTYLLAVTAFSVSLPAPAVGSVTTANNITWTLVGTMCSVYGTGRQGLYLYKGTCTGDVASASWTVNVTGGGGNDGYLYLIDEVSGASGTIVQNVKAEEDQASPISTTLAAYGNANNLPYAVCAVLRDSASSITPETGWSQLGTVPLTVTGGYYLTITSEWKTTQDTTPSFTFTALYSGMIAVELEAASAAASLPLKNQRSFYANLMGL